MELTLPRAIAAQLIREAQAAHPDECCGLLLGSNGRITNARATRNVHPERTRHFEIDPEALIAAHRTARAGGMQLLGYYHSHPVGPPEPSAADRRAATGDGRIWAIIGEGRVTLWRDDPSGFEPS
jgi:proteasome lid subunit RPN8/RPN11